MNKRQQCNHRFAQRKLQHKRFEGGIYANIAKGSIYKDQSDKVDMMTWNVLCAVHGDEAAICLSSAFVLQSLRMFVSYMHHAGYKKRCYDANELQYRKEDGIE